MIRIAYFVLLLGLALDVWGGSQAPSPYAAAVPPRPVQGDLPRNFAASMYRDALARLSFDQPESAVEPLLYLSRADPDLADIQNATAVALYLTRSNRHRRIVELSEHAVELQPDNPVFHVVRVIVDPNRSRQMPDGTLLLNAEAANEIVAAEDVLAQGSPNMRALAQILSSATKSEDPQYPYVLTRFDRLRDSSGLLFTTPDTKSFGRIEDKISARIAQLAADAAAARQSANEAQVWFDKLQKEYQTASPSRKEQLASESARKREEFDRWMDLASAKAKQTEIEFRRLDAFLKHDNATLANLRVEDEDQKAGLGAGSALTAQVIEAPTEDRARGATESVSAGELVSGLHKYYALVIGNKDYQHFQKLKTPVEDAQAVAGILGKKYGFTVKTLLNASRSQLIDALYGLRSLPKDTDNVFVFYAGHGHFDESSNTGYWIPVDAEPASPANWVSNADITAQLRAVSAKRVLVIADSCYSGTLTRDLTISSPDADYLKKIVGRRARMVMTSGGNEPVADGGSNGHSVFANALINTLAENQGLIETTRLFDLVRRRVLDSAMSDQVPLLSTIRDAEHDGGEFFFFPHPAQ